MSLTLLLGGEACREEARLDHLEASSLVLLWCLGGDRFYRQAKSSHNHRRLYIVAGSSDEGARGEKAYI
jgi:hypothetical protein